MTAGTQQRRKQRGIRASRTKLEHALAESDLPRKSQIALANRIADLEDLESIPRDLVSRVFREQPVDAHSIERVARALGVAAETLYLESQGPPTEAETPLRGLGRPDRRRLVAVITVLAGAFIAALVGLSPIGADIRCRAGEWMEPLRTPPDRLGAVVARFAGDDANLTQMLLARSLAGDSALRPYLSVLTTCRRYTVSGNGDLAAREAALRKRARAQLEDSNAQILIWGEMRGQTALVRFISRRSAAAPVTLNVAGRPLQVHEGRVEIALPLSRSEAPLSEIKAMLIGLMAPEDPERVSLRDAARQSFAVSLDWLRASVVSLRNLRRQVDLDLDPRQWGIINNRLCYEERLLGDVDGDADRYEAALRACGEALKVRPRDQFPMDWARTSINLASARLRLHNFASDPDAALALLKEAEAGLLAVAEGVDQRLMPQLWALARRNLGVAYERMGELSSGQDADRHFTHAVAVMEDALEGLNPDFQPVDWAITQQNLCLALYQQGIRRGASGRSLVEAAREHCAAAKQRLSRERVPLSWAMVQNNYAVTLAILAELEGSAGSLAAARSAFAEAQEVYTRSAMPAKWAEVEINIAEISCNIARLSQSRKALDIAEAHGEAALEVLMAKSLTKYRRYTEQLLQRIRSCRRTPMVDCRCSAH